MGKTFEKAGANTAKTGPKERQICKESKPEENKKNANTGKKRAIAPKKVRPLSEERKLELESKTIPQSQMHVHRTKECLTDECEKWDVTIKYHKKRRAMVRLQQKAKK